MEDVGYALMSATTFQTGSIERKVWTEAMTVPRVDLRPDSKATPAAILAIYQNGLSGGVVGTSGNIGARLLPILAESLGRDFGKGFDASNLRYMRLFYQAFPIRDALRHELSWNQYRTLLKGEQEAARTWYMTEAARLKVGRRGRWRGRSTHSITGGCLQPQTGQPLNKRPTMLL